MFITGVCKHLELFTMYMDFPGGSDGKESPCNEGDLGSIPGLGRSRGGGHGSPFQYSYLENPHGQRSYLAGYSPWGCKESDLTEQIRTQHGTLYIQRKTMETTTLKENFYSCSLRCLFFFHIYEL